MDQVECMANVQWLKSNLEDINKRASVYDILNASYDTSVSASMRLSTVYSCIRVISESMGTLPLRVYKLKTNGSKEVDKKAPLYNLLHYAPNSWQTSAEFIEFAVTNLACYGNFYAYIVRLGKEVRELIPLTNSSVGCSYKSGTNEPQYTITLADGKNLICSQKDIFHVKLATYDGLVGVSPIQQVSGLMANANSTQQLANEVYKNGAVVSGVLTTDKALKAETHQVIRDCFYNSYVGSGNAGKPMILDNGMTYQQFKISLVDAQFIESRKYDRDEICGIFRVPPHMVGNLEHATFTNIEQQSLEFVQNSLMPYIRKIEQRIHMQLLTPEEQLKYTVKFDLSGLLRGDSTSQVNYVNTLLNAGVLTINDALAILGMNKQSGCDIRKLPLNTAYMDLNGDVKNFNQTETVEVSQTVDKAKGDEDGLE